MRRSALRRHRPAVLLLLIGVLSLGVVAMHQLTVPVPSSQASTATVSQQAPSPHDGHGTAHHGQAAHTADAGATAASSPSNGSGSPSDHDHLLHLCLAILSAIIVTLATWLLANPWLRAAPARLTHRPGWNTIASRPPRRPHGFPLLLSLGVIRT